MNKFFSSIALLLALSVSVQAQMKLKAGDHLDNLALTSTDDQLYSLKAQKGVKGFILVFMSVSCDHCIMYQGRIEALNKKYKPLGYPVVAISPYGDDPAKYPLDALPAMKAWKKEKQIPFPYLADQKLKTCGLFGIQYTPEAVLLKKMSEGFDVRYIGKIDDNPELKKKNTNKLVENELHKLL